MTDHLVGRLDRAAPLEVAELAASELRLLLIRGWLRDLSTSARADLATEIDRAAASALDVDIVVQQAGHRAVLAAS